MENMAYQPLVLVSTKDLPRPEWLEYRRKGLGGSDAAAVLNISPFRTARDLYYDKLGVVTADDQAIRFEVEQWKEILPSTVQGIRAYLASGSLKCIGEKTADAIVERFGEHSLEVLEHEPERLLEIRGITEQRLEEIKTGYAESRVMRELLLLLAPLKVTPTTALKVLGHFGIKGVELLRETVLNFPANKPAAIDGDPAAPAGVTPSQAAPSYTEDMTAEEICQVMTLEEAREVIVTKGACKGWSMGKVADQRPSSLKFYLSGFGQCDNIQFAAAKLLNQELEMKKAG